MLFVSDDISSTAPLQEQLIGIKKDETLALQF
jgi:hypothetical protein